MVLAKKILFILFAIWSMNGCVAKKYAREESLFVLFKTPVFRYADLGFMYLNADNIKVEIYGNGQSAMVLEIEKDKICISAFECMDKKSFNKNILNENYPEDILLHIFRGDKIFDGLHLVKTRNGFTQNILKEDKYKINYTVLNKQIIFHDTMNGILIKIKRLDS